MTSRSGPPDGVAWLRLHAGGREVAMPAAMVRQILPATGVVPVPLARPGVAGVVAEQGRAIPVYRLADLTGAPGPAEGAARAAAHIVVVEREGALAGLLAERVEPSRGGRPVGDEIVDGIALLSTASIFEGGGDPDAAEAAGGAL